MVNISLILLFYPNFLNTRIFLLPVLYLGNLNVLFFNRQNSHIIYIKYYINNFNI
jgi:hypothetical protein